jgi:hypothetical protein
VRRAANMLLGCKSSTAYGRKAFTTHGRQRLQGFLPQLDEFYFTTAEKKNLENYRCIVPNFSHSLK